MAIQMSLCILVSLKMDPVMGLPNHMVVSPELLEEPHTVSHSRSENAGEAGSGGIHQ